MQTIPETQLRLAVILAALAGSIDAIAFLALGGFFAGAMGADSVRLAAGLAANLSDAMLAGGLILSFIGGVTGATLLGRSAGPQREVRILALVAVLLLLCAALAKPYQATPLLLLTLAMGAIHAVPPRGDAPLPTSLLIQLGQALAGWLGRDGAAVVMLRPALIWAAFVSGALIAVGLYWRIGLATLYVAGLATAGIALWLWWLNRPAPTIAHPDLAAAEQQDGAQQTAREGERGKADQ